uniref:Secreted protein n=1 Tax=Ascaris lumbricoides TaxID=6252 RepID=A0A0M3I3Q2_ASCLU
MRRGMSAGKNMPSNKSTVYCAVWLRTILCGTHRHMIALGGDWKQLLLVVPDATPKRTIHTTVELSAVWKRFHALRLT